MQEIVISYQLEEWDYAALTHYFMKKRRKRSFFSIIMVSALCLYMIALKIMEGGSSWLDFMTFPVLFPLLYVAFILLFWSKWNTRSRVRRLLNSGRNAGALGERKLTFSESGLMIETAFEETKYRWTAFEYLKEDKDHLFLFRTVQQAIIIPKRIFLLDQEQFEVRSFMERKLPVQEK